MTKTMLNEFLTHKKVKEKNHLRLKQTKPTKQPKNKQMNYNLKPG